jgi:hypothetical protein
MSSILKTDALIKTIRRRGFIPRSQETFTDEDFLEMATEEINIGLVPLIQRMHEEHLVYDIDVPLVQGKLKYAIPSRAHGDKIRDVAFVDESGNVYEMFRYSLDDLSEFANAYSRVVNRGFYLQNNDIILTSSEYNVGSKLRISFYMRPNVLVLPEKTGQILQTITEWQTDFLSPVSGALSSIAIGNPSIIQTSQPHGLKNGESVSFSGTDSTPVLSNQNYVVSVIDATTFSIPVEVTTAGTTGSFTKVIEVATFNFSKLPRNFSQELKYDVIQNISPNKIVHYDIPCNSINNSTNSMSFELSRIPDAVNGYYICQAEQSCVPNIPTELHPILAQRVAVACLEAMGDEQNKQSAERKLMQMERDAGTFLDNRVEGAQEKIRSRHSPLAQTLNGLGRRNRRW